MSFFHICLDAVGYVLLEVVVEEAVVVEVIALRTEAGHGRIDVEHVNGLQAVGGSGVEHAVLHHRGRNVEPALGLAVVNYGVVLLDADDVLRGLRNLADARGFAACLLLLLHEPNVIVISIIDATTINSVIVTKYITDINWLNLKPECISAICGYNNFWQLNANLDYFTKNVHSPLIHSWYISILMQFDLIFPITFFIFKKIDKNVNNNISTAPTWWSPFAGRATLA